MFILINFSYSQPLRWETKEGILWKTNSGVRFLSSLGFTSLPGTFYLFFYWSTWLHDNIKLMDLVLLRSSILCCSAGKHFQPFQSNPRTPWFIAKGIPELNRTKKLRQGPPELCWAETQESTCAQCRCHHQEHCQRRGEREEEVLFSPPRRVFWT